MRDHSFTNLIDDGRQVKCDRGLLSSTPMSIHRNTDADGIVRTYFSSFLNTIML